MLEMLTPQFWVDVFKIIMIDLRLSGDNAVVIALACRNLPEAQRRKGIMYGVGGAIGLRVVLTFFAVSLLALPYLKLVGSAAAVVDRHQADPAGRRGTWQWKHQGRGASVGGDQDHHRRRLRDEPG